MFRSTRFFSLIPMMFVMSGCADMLVGTPFSHRSRPVVQQSAPPTQPGQSQVLLTQSNTQVAQPQVPQGPVMPAPLAFDPTGVQASVTASGTILPQTPIARLGRPARGQRCAGKIANREIPDHIIDLAQPASYLRFETADRSAIVAVRTPEGALFCGKAARGVARIENAFNAGRYEVWIGRTRGTGPLGYQLTISRLTPAQEASTAQAQNAAVATNDPNIQRCDRNDAEGCLLVARAWSENPQMYGRAIQFAQRGCDLRSGDACSLQGWMVEQGRGAIRDEATMAALYQRACNYGSAQGCNNLGTLFQTGTGVTANVREAARLYQQACNAGNAFGCSNLGFLYWRGEGVDRSDPLARQYWDQACRANFQDACNALLNPPQREEPQQQVQYAANQNQNQNQNYNYNQVQNNNGIQLLLGQNQSNYGTRNLRPGFEPDPYNVSVVSGGSLDARNLGINGCVGWVTREPDFIVRMSGGSTRLHIYATSEYGDDVTLLVNAADGNWYCNDDANGSRDPYVFVGNAASGQYDIWVGSYQQGVQGRATLHISELPPNNQNNNGYYAQQEPQQAPAPDTEFCWQLRAMETLHTMTGSGVPSALSSRRGAVCGARLEAGTNESWENGQMLRSGTTWYYPNGQMFQTGDTYYYPNGQMLATNATWYYPNGQMMASNGYYYLPNGQSSSESGLISYGCERSDQATCTREADEYRAGGWWGTVSLIEWLVGR